MLYCALTGQLIDKSVDAVKKHMKGKKFQRAKGGAWGLGFPCCSWCAFLIAVYLVWTSRKLPKLALCTSLEKLSWQLRKSCVVCVLHHLCCMFACRASCHAVLCCAVQIALPLMSLT